MTRKFKILTTVKHILDKENGPLLILGIVERPHGTTYLCTTAYDTEKEYFEEELIKY